MLHFLYISESSSPHEKFLLTNPPLEAISHSASDGIFFPIHFEYAFTSFHET